MTAAQKKKQSKAMKASWAKRKKAAKKAALVETANAFRDGVNARHELPTLKEGPRSEPRNEADVQAFGVFDKNPTAVSCALEAVAVVGRNYINNLQSIVDSLEIAIFGGKAE